MDKLTVIKIGGKVVEDEGAMANLASDFAHISGKKILVHGGGKSVTEMSRRLGIPVQMVDGRRITDADTLEVVKMMLAGVANKNVVALLQKNGCNAIGLTGADGDTIRAHKRPLKDGMDYGWVGDVDKVNAAGIDALLQAGFAPVFAAMTHDGQGQMLNTNADTIASQLAVGMSAMYDVELVFCFELPGVLRDVTDPQSLIGSIDEKHYQTLKEEKIIHTGMIPKIDNAFAALQTGVRQVRICHHSGLGLMHQKDQSPGTCITL
jgi:acetylglutamate kinase